MADPPRRAATRSEAKRGRLSRAAEFERVYRRGRSHASRHLVLHVFPRTEGEAAPRSLEPSEMDRTRVGLSVSRKVGGAVERNLVKRLLREAWAKELSRLPDEVDVVVVARPDVRELAEREGLAGVHAALRGLVDEIAGSPASSPGAASRAPAQRS